mmetsp:Transcript_111/g.301  ORF Transcript_111/g.301 Transcript_111/m.301 type:complete len:624 (-) Transcript_111:65-1936(-)
MAEEPIAEYAPEEAAAETERVIVSDNPQAESKDEDEEQQYQPQLEDLGLPPDTESVNGQPQPQRAPPDFHWPSPEQRSLAAAGTQKLEPSGTVNMQSQDAAMYHPSLEHGFEDRRQERRRNGVLKFQIEDDVPDVGGIGWRSKHGHMLKNQAYYAGIPKQNIWDNPTHAGPKTWRAFHGPKLRSDAALMERLDRLDEAQEDWEAKKAFVNTARVHTMDRYNQQKVHNEQKASASEWAPHRRSRREVHSALGAGSEEMDSMPLKELKKMMTDIVLHGDRNAVRMLTARLQQEATWRQAWRDMEKERVLDIHQGISHRKAFNAKLAELSGQPVVSDPGHVVKLATTPRLEELAQPRKEFRLKDITHLSDFRGLIHIDHHHALERRLPGKGHHLGTQFRDQVTSSAEPGWPPPPRPTTPEVEETFPARTPQNMHLARKSMITHKERLEAAIARQDDMVMARVASQQNSAREAAPAPEQDANVYEEELSHELIKRHLVEHRHAHAYGSAMRGSLTDGLRRTAAAQHGRGPLGHLAPRKVAYFYPALVPTVPSGSQSARKPRPAPRKQAAGSRSARAAVGKDAGAGESMAEVSQAVDGFEASLQEVSHLGNFWMRQRGDTGSQVSGTG